jgi:hypothetical protein
MDNTVLKAVSEAVYDYTTTSTRKVVEFQTAVFKDWVDFNKSLWEMTPAKGLFAPATLNTKK